MNHSHNFPPNSAPHQQNFQSSNSVNMNIRYNAPQNLINTSITYLNSRNPTTFNQSGCPPVLQAPAPNISNMNYPQMPTHNVMRNSQDQQIFRNKSDVRMAIPNNQGSGLPQFQNTTQHSYLYPRQTLSNSPQISFNKVTMPNYSKPPPNFQNLPSEPQKPYMNLNSIPPGINSTGHTIKSLNPQNIFIPSVNIPPPAVTPNLFNAEFLRVPPPPVLPNNNLAQMQILESLVPSNQQPPISSLSSENISSPISYMMKVPPPIVIKPGWEKEHKIDKFLEKIKIPKKEKIESKITVQQFRTLLKHGLSLVSKIQKSKIILSNSLEDDDKWNEELKKANYYKEQLNQIFAFFTSKHVNQIKKKLELIKRKRKFKKKLKQKAAVAKVEKNKEREDINQSIDKWLENIKEKNLKLKRETELKKEADSILSEVRRKIIEGKRTSEKIKVFEKLRNARQANAIKKGLFMPEYDEKFQNQISDLKETMLRQLSHYESEEKALKVMLEAEQEGQLEEEALWKIKKLKNFQQKKQKNIVEALFGNSGEPNEQDPIYLFYQYHNSGNNGTENLTRIRQQWDSLLDENGESIPHQWIAPVPPNSAVWETVLEN